MFLFLLSRDQFLLLLPCPVNTLEAIDSLLRPRPPPADLRDEAPPPPPPPSAFSPLQLPSAMMNFPSLRYPYPRPYFPVAWGGGDLFPPYPGYGLSTPPGLPTAGALGDEAGRSPPPPPPPPAK